MLVTCGLKQLGSSSESPRLQARLTARPTAHYAKLAGAFVCRNHDDADGFNYGGRERDTLMNDDYMTMVQVRRWPEAIRLCCPQQI